VPYLIHYPYGCTKNDEPVLPAAITAKTLKDLGLKPEDVMGHVFGGIEPATAAVTHTTASTIARAGEDRTAKPGAAYDFQHPMAVGWWKEGGSDIS